MAPVRCWKAPKHYDTFAPGASWEDRAAVAFWATQPAAQAFDNALTAGRVDQAWGIFNTTTAEKYLGLRFAEAPGAGGTGRGQPPEFHLGPASAACLGPEMGAASVAQRRMARLERQLRALAKRTLWCEGSGSAAHDLPGER
eukprot:8508365-Alexandrium_andersonii.AAC.1